MTHPPRDTGLSLLELVVAMALFALVAVMGLQLLTGTLRIRDRLEIASTETGDLSRALALLRADLTNATPMRFDPPGDAGPRSALTASATGFQLSVSGQVDLPPINALGFHRVDWQLASDGTLSRSFWPVLSPASATSKSPDVPVLTGVTGWAIRTFWAGQGWVGGTNDPNPTGNNTGPAQDSDLGPIASSAYSDQLPIAIEVTLQTRDFGELTLVEVLQ